MPYDVNPYGDGKVTRLSKLRTRHAGNHLSDLRVCLLLDATQLGTIVHRKVWCVSRPRNVGRQFESAVGNAPFMA